MQCYVTYSIKGFLAFNDKNELICEKLFPEDEIIKSWRNHINNQKGDIIIKINNQKKYLSIKKGSRNSVHVEGIEAFKKFLQELGLKKKEIYFYELFHYGIDKYNYKKRLNSVEFYNQNTKIIKKLNNKLSTVDVEKITNRFILCGNNSSIKIAGIIHGTPNDFFYINKNDILKIIRNNINKESNSVHISCLYIQPLNRCLNNNPKYTWGRDYVQIKWYSLFDDIIEYKNYLVLKKRINNY